MYAGISSRLLVAGSLSGFVWLLLFWAMWS